MKAALILVDVINDFFHPRGPNYHESYREILPNILSVLESAREHGVPVIHAMEGHRAGLDDFEWRKLPVHDIKGSFEAEPAEGVSIAPGEFVVRKRRYSAFFATDLDLMLRELRAELVVLVGVKTNVCVRATAQDAFAYGYRVWVVGEAVASNREHLHEASLEDIRRYFGDVVSVEDCVRSFGGG